MTDVFISYSRLDKQFVEKLHETLSSRSRAVWVDWEGIPPTAEWWSEICTGIEDADTFIFVVSPSSLASPICNLELAHAIAHNKRIVPVIWRQAEESDALGDLAARNLDENTRARLAGRDIMVIARHNWQLIARHNWLLFDQPDAFAREFDRLILALDTDLEYVREHTRFTGRIREWLKNNRDTSFLLRDTDLAQAVNWLKSSTGQDGTTKSPTPTDQQRQYIQTSLTVETERRREEKAVQQRVRRLRLASVVLGFVGVIAVVSTVIAGTSATNANNLRATAGTDAAQLRTQAFVIGNTLTPVGPTLTAVQDTLTEAENEVVHISQTLTPVVAEVTAVSIQIKAGISLNESLRLAAASRSVLSADGDPQLAALLALSALSESYSPEADIALQNALDASGRRRVLYGFDSPGLNVILSASFSPDGKLLVTGGTDGAIRIWDVTTGQQNHVEFIKESSLTGSANYIKSVGFLQDTNHIFSVNLGTIRFWDVSAKNVTHQFTGIGNNGVLSVAIASDFDNVYASGWDKTVRAWDISTQKQTSLFETEGQQINDLAVSADEKLLIGAAQNGTIYVWDTASGYVVDQWKTQQGALRALKIAPDGQTVFVAGDDGTAIQWSLASHEQRQTFRGHTAKINSMVVSQDGTQLLTGSGDRNIILWDNVSGQPIKRFVTDSAQAVFSVALTPDQHWIAAGTLGGIVHLWGLVEQSTPRKYLYPTGTWFANFSPDGSRLLVGTGENSVRIVNLTTNAEIINISVFGNSAGAFTPDGKRFATGGQLGIIQIVDSASGKLIRRFAEPAPAVNSLSFSVDGKQLLSVGGEAPEEIINLWEVDTGRLVRQITRSLFDGGIYSATHSDKANLIAAGGVNGTIQLWDQGTGKSIQQLIGLSGIVYSVAFSPDARLLAASDDDNVIKVFDLSTGKELRQLEGLRDSIYDITFSPNSRYLVGGGKEGKVLVWDAITGNQVRVYVGYTSVVESVAISPDGKFIAATGSDGTVRIWDLEYQDWIQYACSLLTRDFTSKDKQVYDLSSDTIACPKAS